MTMFVLFFVSVFTADALRVQDEKPTSVYLGYPKLSKSMPLASSNQKHVLVDRPQSLVTMTLPGGTSLKAQVSQVLDSKRNEYTKTSNHIVEWGKCSQQGSEGNCHSSGTGDFLADCVAQAKQSCTADCACVGFSMRKDLHDAYGWTFIKYTNADCVEEYLKEAPSWDYYGKGGTIGHSVCNVGATNDPKISNAAGQKFDVMSAGVFNLVEVKSKEGDTMLQVNASIVQAALQCSFYIQNITLHGSWLKSSHSEEGLAFRAVSARKEESLEVSHRADEWTKVQELRKSASLLKTYADVDRVQANAKTTLKLGFLTIDVAPDYHVSSNAHFLNIHVAGLNDNVKQNFVVTGLLSWEDSVDVIEEKCKHHTTRNFISMLNRSTSATKLL
eukprot:gnl/MRDRNA2_/MRDRNA2_70296_c0_seq1.p1 gnl/MRDRNA2_/MRDRNA2_70296_c0~~gnl/MRDRNA2_/MRDRNA2_70296_c0_seq1.p1  ORF type:complete len:387 (+),score=44.73 gnl/MRDRNA2_/MRDRNA2_70296_c0_seq1:75-1235(+)